MLESRAWSRQVYGHVYCALRGTLSALTTAGGLRNDPHHTIAGIDVDTPNPCWEYAADAGNPNRINVLLPPDLVNQLRIFALLNQFRLQYPAS